MQNTSRILIKCLCFTVYEVWLLALISACFYMSSWPDTVLVSDVGLTSVMPEDRPCAGAPVGPESGSRGPAESSPAEVQSTPDQTTAGTKPFALCCCWLDKSHAGPAWSLCMWTISRVSALCVLFMFCAVFYVIFNQGYSTKTRLGFRRSKTSKEQFQEAAFQPATDTAVRSEFC